MKLLAAATVGAAALATASAQFDIAAVDQSQPISYPEYLARAEIEGILAKDAIKPLILGGTEVPVGQKTWTVGLRSTATGRAFCGGTLITPKHVLTAAHCYGSIKYVSVGSHYLSGSTDGERIAVTKQTRHPSYSTSGNSNDFLILELASASKYTPAPLLTAAPVAGTTANVAGWGTTSSGGSQSSVLLQVNVPVVAQSTCAAKLSIDSTMLCAGGQTNKDSCQGDSGGPLTTKSGTADALIGVVSWGNGCGLAGYPGVYARVSVVKSWISTTTGNLAKWI